MTQAISLLMAIFVNGVIDRYRGDTKDIISVESGRTLDKVLYTLNIMLIGGMFPVCSFFTQTYELWEQVAVFAVIFGGMSIGWGNPMGAYLYNTPIQQDKLHSWQVGIFKKNAFYALIFRGTLWGILLVPLGYIIGWELLWIFFAYQIATPLAPYISRKIGDNRLHKTFKGKYMVKDMWSFQEYLRGWIAGIINSIQYFV